VRQISCGCSRLQARDQDAHQVEGASRFAWPPVLLRSPPMGWRRKKLRRRPPLSARQPRLGRVLPPQLRSSPPMDPSSVFFWNSNRQMASLHWLKFGGTCLHWLKPSDKCDISLKKKRWTHPLWITICTFPMSLSTDALCFLSHFYSFPLFSLAIWHHTHSSPLICAGSTSPFLTSLLHSNQHHFWCFISSNFHGNTLELFSPCVHHIR
jgi:hypothetical protein